MKKYVDENILSTKKDITTVITTTTNPLSLKDNTKYRLINVNSLTLTYPEDNFEVWMHIKFAASGDISIVFPSNTQYIGAAPTFKNNETWEISIKDKVAICWRIE